MLADDALTTQLASAKKSRFKGHKVLSSKGAGGSFCGLAVEVGEKESHGSFERFKRASRSASVDLSKLASGIASYRSRDGKELAIHWHDKPLELGVWRGGERRDLTNPAMYESPIIIAGWGEGVLEVDAGGERFRSRVDAEGRATFE
ncbi:MAG: hypothetical protein ACYTKD_28320 [Planctomycetota bacterium]